MKPFPKSFPIYLVIADYKEMLREEPLTKEAKRICRARIRALRIKARKTIC